MTVTPRPTIFDSIRRNIRLKGQFGRRMQILFVVSVSMQILYLVTLPISYEGDAGGYFTYAQLLATGWHGPFDLHYMRPPGFPLYLHLLGMTWAATFTGVIVCNAIMGIIMPLLVYGTLYPVKKTLALIAAFAYALSTLPYSYTKVFITEQPYSFLLLLSAYAFSKYISTYKLWWAALVIGSLFAAFMTRNEAVWIAAAAFILLFFVGKPDIRRRAHIVMLGIVVLLATLTWSYKRSEIMHDPAVFGSLYNFTGRQMFWRMWITENAVQRENGPKTQELFSMVPTAWLATPSDDHNWWIGEAVVRQLGFVKGDEFLSGVVREAITAHPRVLWSFAKDGLRYLGYGIDEPHIVWNYDTTEALPFNVGGSAKATMTPGLWAQYEKSYQYESDMSRTIDETLHELGSALRNTLRLVVGTLLLATIWFLPLTSHKFLGLFLFLMTGLQIGAGVLGFGYNGRYEHEILPLLLMTAILSLEAALRKIGLRTTSGNVLQRG